MRNPSAPTASTTATRSAAKGGGGAKTACCSKVGLKRGPWTPEEDELLSSYIKKEGEGRWRTLPKRAGLLRCGKSCRLRWMNYLRPCVKRGHIAPDEEDLILRLHRLLGNRWSLIAGRIPGRTDNEIKNYWNTHLSKKLISQGIDPRTHKPLDPHSVDQFKLASSSSKPTNRKSSSSSSSPKHDHNNNVFNNNNQKIKTSNNERSSNSGVEETTSIGNPIISNKENEYFEDNPNCNIGYKSLLNCSDDGCEMGMMGSIDNADVNVNDEDEDINCSNDDVFSTFLNSLINEEAFTTQMQQQQLHVVNGMLPGSSSDPLVSITSSSFGLGHGWDSSLLSSTFNPNDHLHPSN